MDKAEVEQRFPEAVAFAKTLREVFCDVRLTYAKNAAGEFMGRSAWLPDAPKNQPQQRGLNKRENDQHI